MKGMLGVLNIKHFNFSHFNKPYPFVHVFSISNPTWKIQLTEAAANERQILNVVVMEAIYIIPY